MKKRVLLVGYNFYPEPTGIGKYNGEMMQWLSNKGYSCTVITSYPYYPHWKVQKPYNANKFWYKTENFAFISGGTLDVHRCPMYVPAKPSGIKRILLDLSFLISATLKLVWLLPSKKFDFIIVVAPSFQFGFIGIIYKMFYKATLMYHIQDLQIEAARDLKMIESPKIIDWLFSMEKFIFKKYDIISSISEGMVNRIQKKSGKYVMMLPNWVDTKSFFPIADRDKLKIEFGFKPTDKVVLYSGAIGEKQGLEAILKAADSYRQIEHLKFVICGSGPYKETLQYLAKELALPNVIFFPLQPFNKFNAFLNTADVHLIIQKADASDLVMPSKLTAILAVGGLALVTANEKSGIHDLVFNNNIGIVVDAENQKALNKGIIKAIAEDHVLITTNAQQYAKNFLSIENIMEKLHNVISS